MFTAGVWKVLDSFIHELKQRRWRRLRKRHLKSEFALPQTLSRLFHLVYFVKCWQMFLELNSKGLYQSSGKEKESCCLVFPSSTKREIRHFHVVVVQRRLRNVQKSVMQVQSCCFANLNPLFFFPFSLPSPSSLLKLPLLVHSWSHSGHVGHQNRISLQPWN